MEMIVRQKSTLNERPSGIFLFFNKKMKLLLWEVVEHGRLAVLQEEFLRWVRSRD